MNTLITHPTELAQWHALINEAEQACATHLGEELQSYLVFLLMRYIGATQLPDSVLALEYLNSLEASGQLRAEQLREVGDKCLLYSGLFPGQAERRRVRVSYYVELGISAYTVLATTLAGVKAKVFQQLSEQFVALMDVLQTTRELDNPYSTLQPLQAIELWNDTGSTHAFATLSRYTRALPVKTHFQPTLVHSKTAHVH
ncbi:MAG: hypothetical protein BWK79_14150 [Beggiatoa sp. IS2]|nr:MAG: hypothetical protein BWK79_14150 [Beggiatoa sp. IS2]